MSNVVKFVFLVSVCVLIIAKNGESFKTVGMDVHHRYSDTVKGVMGDKGLPEKGTMGYYAAMARRDHVFRPKGTTILASSSPASSITFWGGNDTYRLDDLGYLHYLYVWVGSPPLPYLVALDTGSDLFWLPCDCTTCARTYTFSNGKTYDLNIYSPSKSNTSSPVPCNSTMCAASGSGCSVRQNTCSYQVEYVSALTSTSGLLVNDVLYMGTDQTPQKQINAPITLGCGTVQTGDFLNKAAINGLLGLGMESVSVPSILASKGIIAANSFSMCFGHEGLGRIEFGDKGSIDQKVTPFTNLQRSYRTYNVTVTQMAVGEKVANTGFTAVFDSGTSFTYLSDPAYTFIADSFNAQITDEPVQSSSDNIFEYCYVLSSNQKTPDVSFTMAGGDQFHVIAPTIVLPFTDGSGYAYCLALVKSDDINLVGQNFMTGYRMVFDRDQMVLGWKESDCSFPVSSGNASPSPTDGQLNSPDAPSAPSDAPSPPSATRPPSSSFRSPPPPPLSISGSFFPPPPPPLSIRPLRPLLSSDAALLSSMGAHILMVLVSFALYHYPILCL